MRSGGAEREKKNKFQGNDAFSILSFSSEKEEKAHTHAHYALAHLFIFIFLFFSGEW